MGNKVTCGEKLICISGNAGNRSKAPYYYASNFREDAGPAAFRRVIYTSPHLMQWVRMALKPGEEIGLETHNDVDQFFLVASGSGRAQVGNNYLPLQAYSVVIVSKGTQHNVTAGEAGLVLYTMYTPAEHEDGLVELDKPQA